MKTDFRFSPTGMAILATSVQQSRETDERLRMYVESMADELVVAFKRERKALQETAFAEVKALAAIEFEEPKFPWCSLNLFVERRDNASTLRIGWRHVHKNQVIPDKYKTKSIKVEKGGQRLGNYNLPMLLREAKPFERDLVEAYEMHARKLRLLNRYLSTLRQSSREMLAAIEKVLVEEMDKSSD